MLQKLGKFLRPHGTTIFFFLALILMMPVLYINSEPERTNYRVGEEQHRLMKTEHYGSPLDEYLFHTNGNLDLFIGIIARDYFINYIGILLLALYYVIACSLNGFIDGIRKAAIFKKV